MDDASRGTPDPALTRRVLVERRRRARQQPPTDSSEKGDTTRLFMFRESSSGSAPDIDNFDYLGYELGLL